MLGLLSDTPIEEEMLSVSGAASGGAGNRNGI